MTGIGGRYQRTSAKNWLFFKAWDQGKVFVQTPITSGFGAIASSQSNYVNAFYHGTPNICFLRNTMSLLKLPLNGLTQS